MVTGTELFLGMLNNLVVLILLVAVYGVFINQLEQIDRVARQIVMGAMFGVFAIICMYVKIPVYEGVIVDQRNAIVALSGAFGGPVSALMSALFAGLYRLYLGGAGAMGGVVGVSLAAIAGTIMYLLPITHRNLITTAIASILATVFLMPGFLFIGNFEAGFNLMIAIGPQFGTATCIGIFMGSVLLNRENRRFRIERERERAKVEREAALDEAVRANRAKSQFMATMSHELRTPLNAILGFSDLLLMQGNEDLPAEKRKDYLQIINASGQHLLSLINDILDIATIEAGKRQIEKTEVNLLAVLRASLDNFERDVAEKSLTVRTTYPEEGLVIHADERALAQITLNLLSNAVKFTAPGGTIALNAKRTNGHVLIEVVDNGIGIPAERLASVMEPFSRPSEEAHLAAPGTGLGLSIVKSLVELHEGEVRLDSEEGTGTTVTVQLPASDGTAEAA